MTLLTTLLLYGAAAFGFFLLVDGLGYLAVNTGDRGESRRRRRLEAGVDQSAETQVEKIAQEEDDDKTRTSVGAYIDRLLRSAHSEMTRGRVYFMMLGFGLVIFAALYFLASWLPIAAQIAMAAAFGVFIPIQQLRSAAAKRIKKFQEQFPDALDLIVRSLRIGHPISAALQTISKEMPAPLGPEFGIAARQVMYGKTPPEAIESLSQRIKLQDVRFFSVAVQIHHEGGGNLAEILSGLSKIIRSRFQLFRKVSALTVEGRFSAWFLSLFPVVMVFAMNGLQPGYYEKVSDFPYFTHAVVLTVVLLLVNVVAMRMITKLEV